MHPIERPFERMDWDRMLKAAAAEGFLPTLHRHLIETGRGAAVPPDVAQLFEVIASSNAERNRRILDEGLHVCRLLNEIGIEPVALKGLAYLIGGIYPDQAARYLADIDLLLPVDDVARASRHLLENRFFQHDADSFTELRHHYPAIRRPDGPFVELHHQLGLGVCNRLLPASQVLLASSPITVDGATLRLPSPTHLVVHLILHSSLAHSYRDRISPPLRALYDLKQLQAHLGPRIDWPLVASIYAAAGQSSTLRLHLAQARDILGLTPPLPIRLAFSATVRLHRRRWLTRYPVLRFFDPTYLCLSVFSRRIRLVPGLIRNPSLWPRFIKRRFSSTTVETT